MRIRACHIACALLLGLLLASCGGRPRIIPRATMTDIFADMFLADQWIRDHSDERKRADTSLFYDPIFARYGYTFEDYDATMKRYLEDPDKFSRIFRDAAAKLKKKEALYEKKAKQVKDIRDFNNYFKNKYSSVDFDADTILWSLPDTVRLDSLTLDSLRRDSLFRDSVLRESFRLDSLRRDSLMRDSLIRKKASLDSSRVLSRARRVRKQEMTINQINK
ncbi:MAG: DUF4296 domain-containing protein [Bacteroidales bacterium]|nr:DUF4296 domain-containing protein [Bacteroidales bacterium]